MRIYWFFVIIGLVKAKKYDWKDSNLAMFGSDTEKQVKSKYLFQTFWVLEVQVKRLGGRGGGLITTTIFLKKSNIHVHKYAINQLTLGSWFLYMFEKRVVNSENEIKLLNIKNHIYNLFQTKRPHWKKEHKLCQIDYLVFMA